MLAGFACWDCGVPTCTNRRSIRRQGVEARALKARRELFFEPAAFAAFCEGFTAEMNMPRREHLAQLAGARRELGSVDREIRKLVQAINDSVSLLVIKDELARRLKRGRKDWLRGLATVNTDRAVRGGRVMPPLRFADVSPRRALSGSGEPGSR
jgi:hypothetical protein